MSMLMNVICTLFPKTMVEVLLDKHGYIIEREYILLDLQSMLPGNKVL